MRPNITNIRVKETKMQLQYKTWGSLSVPQCTKSQNSWCSGIMYRSIPKPPMPPPGQTPGHLTFLKNFGQIPRYVASLDGQMPHLLEL